MDNRKAQALESLELHNGIVTAACQAIGLPRSTFYLWLKEDEEFKAAADEIQDVAIDFVESKLFEKIRGVTIMGKGYRADDDEPPTYELPPSDTAIIFYLKTKGKKRGYVERSEIDHTTNGKELNTVTVFQLPDNGRNSIQDNQAASGLSDEST